MSERQRLSSSFRDPSGYVFSENNTIKRVINPIYFDQYDALTNAGFYSNLFDKGYLIRHSETLRSNDTIIIEPDPIAFISYPYEWSFLQYKHAALLTLQIQIESLKNNFSLKDASAFNVTFHQGKPVFIDSLSFEIYKQDSPWVAYKQFIMHFLGPLLLCKYYGLDYLKILLWEIDGVPLKKLSKLLPVTSYFNPTVLTNVHLLARYEEKHASSNKSEAKLSKASQMKLLESFYIFVKGLKVEQQTEWDHYYNQINYSDSAYQLKKNFTRSWFESIGGKSLIDMGGNDGTFSRELQDMANLLLVADIDANAVGQNYKKVIQNKESKIIPIVADVLNPAAAIGFNNQERASFIERVKKLNLSGCLALAVIHHITLSGNIPFLMSAGFFAQIAPELLIEFPTREDSWVQFLLDSKRDAKSHFDFYNEVEFEKQYSVYFIIVQKHQIEGSARIMYSLKRKTQF